MKKILHSILLLVFSVITANLPIGAQNVTPTGTQNYTVSYVFRQAFTPSLVPSTVNIDQAIPIPFGR